MLSLHHYVALIVFILLKSSLRLIYLDWLLIRFVLCFIINVFYVFLFYITVKHFVVFIL